MQSGPRKIVDMMNDPIFVAALPTTRSEALRLGLPKYLSTKLCPKQHNAYRLTKNGSCGQCASDVANKSNGVKKPRSHVDKKWNDSDKAKDAKQRWKERNPKWAWVVSAVGGARTRSRWAGVEFNLTNEYIYGITSEQCPVLGTAFIFLGAGNDIAANPSIDRIDPNKGYVIGNVAVISRRANMIKSNATSDELYKVANWLRLQGN